MRYLGVDLHKNRFTVCYRSEDGREAIREYGLKSLNRFKQQLRLTDEVAVETTTNTRYFHGQIVKLVKKVRVVDTQQFKVISESVRKTDKHDAAVLAEFLSKGMIPEVRMLDPERAKLNSLIGTRDKLVKLRTTLKNKIHNILSANGIVSKKEILSSEKGLQKVEDMVVDDISKFEIKIITEQIRGLNKGIVEIEHELIGRSKNLPGFKNLTSIDGIGDRSATIFLSRIGNVKDFANSKKLAAFFGIVPRTYQSNETVRYGRITKRGDKIARTALVQCTLIAIRKSDYLRKFYERLKAKKGSGKAIIATARKLLDIIYDTLKNNWVFEDFSNFALAQ